MIEALARSLGWPSGDALLSPAGAHGGVAEVVEHSHRAVVSVTSAGVFEVRLYRCGQEGEGVVRYRTDIGDLEAARATALELCEVEKSPQLSLFG